MGAQLLTRRYRHRPTACQWEVLPNLRAIVPLDRGAARYNQSQSFFGLRDLRGGTCQPTAV